MERKYAIITSDEYFYCGIESIIKETDENNEVIRIHSKDINNVILLKQLVFDSYVFIIYLHTVSANFITLSRLEEMMAGVILFSKDKRITDFCQSYGVNCVNIHSIHEVDTILKLPNWLGHFTKGLLSLKEKRVLIKLLNGWSIRKLAVADGLSYKTISSHKRNGLTKLGIKNINLLVNSASCDVLKVL
ncbi:regulatory LuxR family protein [Serratia fonticola]|jgi:DNA-binding CsgD family transcriptional regulator|uniref:Regulatory LuxR family protein n=1 Tax=Serratia fonticola TaxID=47917 RepID=A0A542CVK9_SERFO|nr:LuxR C-terminal-related transcriptional regulator [Serratia fonticola]TQI78148.1 regulatory LuxR family protein [Serratia fonticola]TQI94854.1 regulatory LuxR family protein [Serratia fonticola]TVZ69352.1 regulatory LuxR family protein [Serratia fonticola]